MSGLLLVLTIAGTTALFLYGLKLMSESLQKIMGDRLQLMLSSLSSNRTKGILTGILITALIQSSSATTVMVVSFVNTGILRLAEAMGVIMGANIGTTLTAWLIAFFGFKVNIAFYTFPLIGLGIPFIFSNSRKVKNWGELILGFSLLFIALEFLKTNVPSASDSWLIEAIERLNSIKYLSYFVYLAVGILFTIIVRSSNAIFALILVLSTKGWLPFEMAATMLLGVNIGTTIAANTAARVANVTAKRAALAHLLFKVFGVLWITPIFSFFLKGIIFINDSLGGIDPAIDVAGIPISLALFHTLFNVINTMILFGFSKQITNLVAKKIPTEPTSENEFKLTHIKIGLLSTPDASLYQAQREILIFAEGTRKMFRNVERILMEKNDKEYQTLKEKIRAEHQISKRYEEEIASYLTKVGEGRLSETSSKSLRSQYKMIDDIINISNSCMNILNATESKRLQKIEFPEQVNNNILLLFNMVKEALDTMVTMQTHEGQLPFSMAKDTENEINNFRDILKSEHLNNLEKSVYKYDAGLIYNDIVSQCERIGDFAINVDESFKGL
jgi:phosphate:Na+ symporter